MRGALLYNRIFHVYDFFNIFSVVAPNPICENIATSNKTPPSSTTRDRLHHLWLSVRHMSTTKCSTAQTKHKLDKNVVSPPTRFWSPFPQRRHNLNYFRRRSLCTNNTNLESSMSMTTNCPPSSEQLSRDDKPRPFSIPNKTSSTSSPSLSTKLRNFFLQDLRKSKTKLSTNEETEIVMSTEREGEDTKVELIYWKKKEDEAAKETSKMEDMPKDGFYLLDVHLKEAQALLAKDACGTSDPYVKFKIDNQIVAKSQTITRTLDPKWDEYFVFPIDDIHQDLVIKVYDYDYLLSDDYLGSARIPLANLELGV